jgi:basic membrane lipoprotein Med (substrate-binding protein (PBP1-ABC) superfamily)
VSYIGNWDDVSAGKEQAIAQIAQNADIIFQNADAARLGVFQAAKEAKGVRVIGSNSNQNNVASDVTLGSVVIDLPRAFLAVAREVKDGNFTPRVISLGLHDNIVRLVLNPGLESTIPARVQAQVDSARIALDSEAAKQSEIK